MKYKRFICLFSLLFLLINFYSSNPVYANDSEVKTGTFSVSDVKGDLDESVIKAMFAEYATMANVCSDDLNGIGKKNLADKLYATGAFTGDFLKGSFKVVSYVPSVAGSSVKNGLVMTKDCLQRLRGILLGGVGNSNVILYVGNDSYDISCVAGSKFSDKVLFTASCNDTYVRYSLKNISDGTTQERSDWIQKDDTVDIVTQTTNGGNRCMIMIGYGTYNATPRPADGGKLYNGIQLFRDDEANAVCKLLDVRAPIKNLINSDNINNYSFSNDYSDFCIPLSTSVDSSTGNTVYKPLDNNAIDKVSNKATDVPDNYKTDNLSKDSNTDSNNTGSNTGGNSSFSLPDVLGGIVDLFKSLLKAVNSILSFFTIDFSKISSHMNYGDIMKSHFSPVFDVFNLFSNVHVDSSVSSSDAGKFYMKIPKEMGGDGQEHCVLDLTVGAVYVNKAREIIKYGIWIYFLWYLFRNFSPKFNVGG